MKTMKKLLALALVLVMLTALGATAFAAGTPSITIETTSNSSEAVTDTTVYTWYRILDAQIDTDPTSSDPDQTGGEVAYFVTTQARATALESTGLFNVVQVGTDNKWYVELKSTSTTGATIAAAFGAESFNLEAFETGTFSQNGPGGSATTGTVAAGYYYITSTAGTEVVVQTLSPVTITEKNTFPTVTKALTNATTDANAQMGVAIPYTITVSIPATANDQIVVTDTLPEGLTLCSSAGAAAASTDITVTGANASVALTESGFTVTFAANTVAALTAATEVTITYYAYINSSAPIDTAITNSVVLTYGTHYTSVEKTATTQTSHFSFNKIDGTSKDALTGAEFQLLLDGTAVELVEVTAGVEYRVATPADTTKVTKITTNGNTVTINGLDKDASYKLDETKAPTGYNKLEAPVDVTVGGETAVDVENNKGAVLPSTGGIGTTLFYVIGGILVVGAGVVLVSKRRVSE